MLRKLPIVAVFGQGTPLTAERAKLARNVGCMVAKLGAHLLTGGGYGVMAAAAEGFIGVEPRAGSSIGIVPREPGGPLDMPNHALDGRAYPNPFVEIVIMTPLPPRTDEWRSFPTRNHINVFTADAIIVLPGGAGTRNELDMSISYGGELARSCKDRRTVLLGPREEFTAEHQDLFVHAATLAEAERHLRHVLAVRGFSLEPQAASKRVAS